MQETMGKIFSTNFQQSSVIGYRATDQLNLLPTGAKLKTKVYFSRPLPCVDIDREPPQQIHYSSK